MFGSNKGMRGIISLSMILLGLLLVAPWEARSQDENAQERNISDGKNKSDRKTGVQKNRSGDPRKRWEQFSEQEKKEIRKKYEYFKSLSKEERKELRKRHRNFKKIKESLSESENNGPRPPRHSEGDLYGRIRDFLNERQDELAQELPHLREGDDNDRGRRAKRMRKHLEDQNFKQMHSFLDRLVKEGVITPDEAGKIKSMPRDEKMDKLFRLGKDLRLLDMEGWLPPEEEKKWRKMEPYHFHRKMRHERERGQFRPPREGLGRLTPEQKELLDGMPPSREKREQMRRFMDENIRHRLEQAGVEQEQIDRLLSLPPHERGNEVRKKLKSLEEQGKTIPPEIRRLIDEYKDKRPNRGKDRDDRRQRRGKRKQEGKRFF